MVLDRFEPRFLPKYQTSCLATPISATVAPDILQMYPMWKRSSAGTIHRVTGLVSTLLDTKPAATIFEHLRHKRQIFEFAVTIERLEDLLLAANLYPVSSTQCHNHYP